MSFIKNVDYNRSKMFLVVEMEYQDKYELRTYHHKYRYVGVPPTVAQGLKEATSKGKFYNKHVKDNYGVVKIF